MKFDGSTRFVTVSRRARIGLALGCAAVVAWGILASASLGVAVMERNAEAASARTMRAGLESRIAALELRNQSLDRDLAAAMGRIETVSGALTRKQVALSDAAEVEQELTIAVETLRAKLRAAVTRRDAALRTAQTMRQRRESAEARLAALDATEAEWTSTIAAVSDALNDAVTARDAALARASALGDRLAALQDDRRRADERRNMMYSRLEDAVQIGLGAMDKVFARAGLDVDDMVKAMRRDYSGIGGPLTPVVQGAQTETTSADVTRIAALIDGLERVNLMQMATTKLPFAKPVHSAFRLTSGYGMRGRRMHSGLDMAADRGTPIYATADGVVTYAGWQSGYGRVIEIRHAFGYETVYAHLNKIRVKKGQRVARDERIGDMGSSGRSTGNHVHYEIRSSGKAVNPLKYIEAARNVL